MDGAQAKRGVGRLGEVGCVLVGVQLHVPQRKHPGLQRRWSLVRTPLFEPPRERRLGQRQATGGVAASHRARAVVGRTAAGGWVLFVSFPTWPCISYLKVPAWGLPMSSKLKKRDGPQSPVGRGRRGGALLQAGFEPAIYAMTLEDGYHYASLPTIPFSPVRRRIKRSLPMIPLSFSPALLHGMSGGVGAGVTFQTTHPIAYIHGPEVRRMSGLGNDVALLP